MPIRCMTACERVFVTAVKETISGRLRAVKPWSSASRAPSVVLLASRMAPCFPRESPSDLDRGCARDIRMCGPQAGEPCEGNQPGDLDRPKSVSFALEVGFDSIHEGIGFFA